MSNPYAEALEALLTKIIDPGRVGEGQRRGIRRSIQVVNEIWNETAATNPGWNEPLCVYCDRRASEISELVKEAKAEGVSPADYARGDGTYNRRTNHFACTDDYLKLGMPQSPGGWKAP